MSRSPLCPCCLDPCLAHNVRTFSLLNNSHRRGFCPNDDLPPFSTRKAPYLCPITTGTDAQFCGDSWLPSWGWKRPREELLTTFQSTQLSRGPASRWDSSRPAEMALGVTVLSFSDEGCRHSVSTPDTKQSHCPLGDTQMSDGWRGGTSILPA